MTLPSSRMIGMRTRTDFFFVRNLVLGLWGAKTDLIQQAPKAKERLPSISLIIVSSRNMRCSADIESVDNVSKTLCFRLLVLHVVYNLVLRILSLQL